MRYFMLVGCLAGCQHRERLAVLPSVMSVAGEITVQFNREPDPRTLDERSIFLANGPEGMLTHWAGTTTVTFRPLEPLQANRDYALVIGEGVRDFDGHPLKRPETLHFSLSAGQASAPFAVR